MSHSTYWWTHRDQALFSTSQCLAISYQQALSRFLAWSKRYHPNFVSPLILLHWIVSLEHPFTIKASQDFLITSHSWFPFDLLEFQDSISLPPKLWSYCPIHTSLALARSVYIVNFLVHLIVHHLHSFRHSNIFQFYLYGLVLSWPSYLQAHRIIVCIY